MPTINPVQTKMYCLSGADNSFIFGASTNIDVTTGQAPAAVSGSNGATWNVTNAGTLIDSAWESDGVALTAAGSVTNQATGQISGSLYGVFIGGAAVITNGGAISGVRGIELGASGTVTNQHGGAITGLGALGAGVWLTLNGQVANQAGGSITGVIDGVHANGAGAGVQNAGVILASGAAGDGVDLEGGGQIVNAAGGAITGGAYGVVLTTTRGQSSSVTNAGVIGGSTDAVSFKGAGAATLTLKTGSVLGGDASGSTAAGAVNSLVLQGHGGEGSNFANFDTLTMTGDGTWVLDGVSTFKTIAVNSGDLQVGDLAHTGAALSGAVAVAAGATLSGDGSINGTVTNAGLVNAADAGGVLTLHGAVKNTGTLEASAGTLDVKGAVTGAGGAVVNGGDLKLESSFSENVTFASGGGALHLAQSKAYSGAVSGFSNAGATVLDLADVAFAGANEAVFSGTAASGVLTVSDGTNVAKIRLMGDYMASAFVAQSDGHGGTLVSVGAPTQQALLAAHH